jgi:hypothetical protein
MNRSITRDTAPLGDSILQDFRFIAFYLIWILNVFMLIKRTQLQIRLISES